MFPEFDGREAYGWLIMVEQHCEAKGVSEEEKFSGAEKALTGEAFMWWFCWRRRNQKATWWEFVEALLRKFEPELEPYMPEPVQDSEEEEIPGKQEVLEAERRTVVVEAKPEANSVLLAKSEIKPYSPENSEMEASRKDSEFAMAAEQTAEVSRCQPVTVVDYIDCTLTAKGEKIDAEGEIKIKRLQEGSSMEKWQICSIHGRKKVQPIVLPQISDLGFDWERRPPRKPPDSCLCTAVTANRLPDTFIQTSVLCSSMVAIQLETKPPDRSGGSSHFILGDSCRSDLVANRPPAMSPDLAETAVVGYCGLELVRTEESKGRSLIRKSVTVSRPPAKPPDFAVMAGDVRFRRRWLGVVFPLSSHAHAFTRSRARLAQLDFSELGQSLTTRPKPIMLNRRNGPKRNFSFSIIYRPVHSLTLMGQAQLLEYLFFVCLKKLVFYPTLRTRWMFRGEY
ncbi:uncharacterized protein LOC130714167 [Lotus japonicus]|uniref:uncharacterized protein LOC130714167 n=1 Tax=Lotus japonicus TaxID=34305 RepID=UPI002587D264|nr:uncharacterized protein LOC130714167 [Lotus japonicus]